MHSYEESLKYYRDLKNSLDTAKQEGVIEGIEKVAKNALKMGKSISEIIELTGLTKKQIDDLKYLCHTARVCSPPIPQAQLQLITSPIRQTG